MPALEKYVRDPKLAGALARLPPEAIGEIERCVDCILSKKNLAENGYLSRCFECMNENKIYCYNIISAYLIVIVYQLGG